MNSEVCKVSVPLIPGTSVYEKTTRRWLAMTFTIGYTKQTARLPLQATDYSWSNQLGRAVKPAIMRGRSLAMVWVE